MKRLPVAWLLLAICLAGTTWLGTRDLTQRLSTQVTDLLPANERDPGVRLVRSLATTEHARTLLLVVDGLTSPSERSQAHAILDATLGSSPLIAEIWAVDAPQLPEATVETWTDQAVAWFWPQWWEARGRPTDADIIATQVVDALSAFLEQPESAFWEDHITADPFLLVPRSMEQLGDALNLATTTDAPGAEPTARWWVRLAVSPFSKEGQEPVFRLLQEAEAALAKGVPGATLRDAGINRFAAASEAAIRAEITRLNLLVALSVGILCLLCLRRRSILLSLVLIVATTLICGAVVTLLLFPRVHVLTLVIGSILIGVAVDYGLHVFLEADSRSPGERLRKVARPLLVGSLSTIGGFLILTMTDLPMLRQMGVFIAAGLATALAASLLYAATPVSKKPVRGLERIRPGSSARPFFLLFIMLTPLLAGLFQIEWADDIRELDFPLPDVHANDAAVREAFGTEEGTAYLLWGNSWASVATTAEQLDLPETATSLVPWISGPELVQTAHAAATQLPLEKALRDALEEGGFSADAFAPFFDQWNQWTGSAWSAARYEMAVSAQLASLPGPAALMAGGDAQNRWWLIRSPPPLQASFTEHLIPLAQLDSLNAVFTRYRQEAMKAAGIGLGILALGLLAGFGLRIGVAVLLLPVFPALLVLGTLGWLGHSLNLFHLLGAFLSVCLTVDYIVFALQARRWRHPLPASITLSALTTSISFGWLATSAIPAVAALGLTVAPAVLLAWFLALSLTANAQPLGIADTREIGF